MIDRDIVSQWHVLIIEDEPDNLEVAVRVLEFYGARTTTARNGEEGLARLESLTPTFILLDLSMPRMDGWETLHRIRSYPKTASLPVIALTAHAMKGDPERARTAGFDGYMTKPFSPLTFLDDLVAILSALPAERRPKLAKEPTNGKLTLQPETLLLAKDGRK